MTTGTRARPGARLHHDHFGAVARGAAAMLIERLHAAGFERGTVVDLAAGSGILSRAMAEAGFTPFGVDISQSMLELARQLGPGTQLVHGSLWDVELPPCVAVTAVGEAFCYATDPTAGLEALSERLHAIHRALEPGGLLLFDVAGPGRSGPAGARHLGWRGEHHAIVLDESEDAAAAELTRHIATFVPAGSLYRRVDELHVLRLYAPEEVEALLRAAGFDYERLDGYGGYPTLHGWHVFAARRSGDRKA
jgi:SAM-dependent methyltransferase